jgi:hypothetical protein
MRFWVVHDIPLYLLDNFNIVIVYPLIKPEGKKDVLTLIYHIFTNPNFGQFDVIQLELIMNL